MSLQDEEMINQFLTDISADEQEPNEQDEQDLRQDGLEEQDNKHLLGLPQQQEVDGKLELQQKPQPGDGNVSTTPNKQRLTRNKCKDLSAFTKWAIVARYFDEENRVSERLYTGSLPKLCEEFSVSKRTIQRIVWEYKTQIEKGMRVPDMTNKKAGRGDSQFTREVTDNIKKLKNVYRKENKKSFTVRALAEAYEKTFKQKISYMTLYRYEQRAQRAEKPIKFAKSSTQFHHQNQNTDQNQYQYHQPYQQHQVQSTGTDVQSSSSSVDYSLGEDHMGIEVEQEVVPHAAGFYYLHQDPLLYNSQAQVLTPCTAALPIISMQPV